MICRQLAIQNLIANLWSNTDYFTEKNHFLLLFLPRLFAFRESNHPQVSTHTQEEIHSLY